VYQINENEPNAAFAAKYIQEALAFFDMIEQFRAKDLQND
jgi:sulfite reductase (ferredoxin)